MKRKKIERKPRIISIMGVCEGCGVTHTCVAIANYLVNVKGKRVALVELTSKKSLGYFAENGQRMDPLGGFFVKGICIYCGEEISLANILLQGYDYVILDMGSEIRNFLEEFLRSDLGIVVTNMSDWKKHMTYTFLSNFSEASANTIYLNVFGKDRKVRTSIEEIGKGYIQFPYELKPLCISSKNFVVYERILSML